METNSNGLLAKLRSVFNADTANTRLLVSNVLIVGDSNYQFQFQLIECYIFFSFRVRMVASIWINC